MNINDLKTYICIVSLGQFAKRNQILLINSNEEFVTYVSRRLIRRLLATLNNVFMLNPTLCTF